MKRVMRLLFGWLFEISLVEMLIVVVIVGIVSAVVIPRYVGSKGAPMCDEATDKMVEAAEAPRSAFYEDATAFEAEVKLLDRPYMQPIMIRYRPPQSIRLVQFFAAQKRAVPGPELLKLHVEFICQHMEMWTLKDSSGQPVEFMDGNKPREATWRRLDFDMITAISEVIQDAAPSTEALRKNF